MPPHLSRLHSLSVPCAHGCCVEFPCFVDRFRARESRMVGAGKPNRSEEQGTLEEQEQHAQKVRAYLDATAPKRQLKPARSDAAEKLSSMAEETTGSDPPEHVKYLQLVATGVPLETQGSGDVSEDYTESEYYQYMAAIDKAHHTTGSGFIKVDKLPEGFHLSDTPPSALRKHHSGNPAMNDWEPAPPCTSMAASSKPSRSESSSDYSTLHRSDSPANL